MQPHSDVIKIWVLEGTAIFMMEGALQLPTSTTLGLLGAQERDWGPFHF